ncbi:MAG: hypothetical protein ABIA77_00375 [Candidatus Omnitrophota bacterium]
MKYRTVIEIVCDAADKDDAYHIAGEYLRGNIESDVTMNCATAALKGSILGSILVNEKRGGA